MCFFCAFCARLPEPVRLSQTGGRAGFKKNHANLRHYTFTGSARLGVRYVRGLCFYVFHPRDKGKSKAKSQKPKVKSQKPTVKKMITPKEIKTKAERKYRAYLAELVEEIPFTRIIIRGNKSYTKSSLPEFEKEMTSIISASKERKKFGYTLEFQRVKTKHLGTQDLPIAIYFESATDFLKYLGKEKEVDQFKINAEKIISTFPELKEWIIKNALKVIQYQNEWEDLLKVCRYFRQHPQPNLYIRELPITVHTKFIEKNKGILKSLLDIILPDFVNEDEKLFEKRFHLKYSEPLVRFKILDQSISAQFFSGLDDLAIPLSQFEALQLPIESVLVVENKTTLYTTLTLPAMHKSIAIFGSGYSVYNLKNVNWLSNLELLYWGDIDVQGFEILSQFRSYFPHAKSVGMDRVTFDACFEHDLGTPSTVTVPLNLTDEEEALYELLKLNNWRLEQEKIPLGIVLEWFPK